MKRGAMALVVVSIAACAPCPGLAADRADHCGTYPDEVTTGYSDCILRDAGEPPLWRGELPGGVTQRLRFTFTEGHGVYTKAIDITQRADGRGELRLRVFRRDGEGGWEVSTRRKRHLSAGDMARIDELGAASGNWAHRVGSWDGDDIFVHCETLDMERETREGYRFASLNISCNNPVKLMPLVRLVTELAGLKPFADRQMY